MANRRGKQNNWVSVALTIIAVVIVFFRILNGVVHTLLRIV